MPAATELTALLTPPLFASFRDSHSSLWAQESRTDCRSTQPLSGAEGYLCSAVGPYLLEHLQRQISQENLGQLLRLLATTRNPTRGISSSPIVRLSLGHQCNLVWQREDGATVRRWLAKRSIMFLFFITFVRMLRPVVRGVATSHLTPSVSSYYKKQIHTIVVQDQPDPTASTEGRTKHEKLCTREKWKMTH